MSELIAVRIASPDPFIYHESGGLAIRHAPHFALTAAHSRPFIHTTPEYIWEAAVLTHIATGLLVASGSRSLRTLAVIAVVLEALPMPWDSSDKSVVVAASRNLPQRLRRWLGQIHKADVEIHRAEDAAAKLAARNGDPSQ